MPTQPDGEHDARAVERLHEAAEAGALLAEPPVVGHEHVVEEQLGVDDAAIAELRIGGPKRRPSSPRSSTNAVTPLLREPGLGLREHDVEVGDAAVRDPGLLTREHVAAVAAACERRHAGGVRAEVGLGRRERRSAAGADPRRAASGSARCCSALPSASTGAAKKPPEVTSEPSPPSPKLSSSWITHSVRQLVRRRRRRTRPGSM